MFWFFYLSFSFPSGKQGKRLKDLALFTLAIWRRERIWLVSVHKFGIQNVGRAEGRFGKWSATDESANVYEITKVVWLLVFSPNRVIGKNLIEIIGTKKLILVLNFLYSWKALCALVACGKRMNWERAPLFRCC